jgi:hypothetical protein
MPFDPETMARLRESASLVVGTVSATGEPHAGRGWGIDACTGETDAIRLLLDASDTVTIDHCAAGGRVAVTVANVRTLESLQIKGTAIEVGPAAAGDTALADQYCDEFFTAIVETDRHSRAVLESWRPRGLVACRIEVDSMYDQTPGPRAGAVVSDGPS